ncbi:MAG: hypothetical protein ACYDDF_05225 [Thermoplasmatota archaeon]
MRVAGTVPTELGHWASSKIADREYHNWSHLLESALKALRDQEGTRRKATPETKGVGGR